MPPCVQYDDLWPGGPRFARSGAGFALGTDSLYHEVSGWRFDDAPARFNAKKVYTVCVPAQDGGSFDLSSDAKEVTLSIVLAR